jgi:predicted metal-dependent hydrolase
MHFIGQQLEWIAKQRAKVRRPEGRVRWTDGSTVLLDGIDTAIAVERVDDGLVARYGGRSVVVTDPDDVRAAIEKDLRVLAAERLVPRLRELASELEVSFTKVTIRNQRSRWGSCSRVGAIALNFRLVQMPPAVSDYVLIHELMHLQQQNHGPRFWRLVERACPGFRDAERWLRAHGRLLF